MGTFHCYYKTTNLGISVVLYICPLKVCQTNYWIFQETSEGSFHWQKFLVVWGFKTDCSRKQKWGCTFYADRYLYTIMRQRRMWGIPLSVGEENLVQLVLVYYNSVLFLLLIIHSVNHGRLRSMLTTWKGYKKAQLKIFESVKSPFQ